MAQPWYAFAGKQSGVSPSGLVTREVVHKAVCLLRGAFADRHTVHFVCLLVKTRKELEVWLNGWGVYG